MENLLVKVGKFIFLVDFFILDMEEDEEIPIFLGRPFLYTGRVFIDLQQRKIIWRLGDEEKVFKVFDPTINSSSSPTCNFVQATNKMKTIMTKFHLSVGKEDSSRKEVIPKDPGWSKKKGDSIIIQALGYGVDEYTR